jgi:hypothetical protein
MIFTVLTRRQARNYHLQAVRFSQTEFDCVDIRFCDFLSRYPFRKQNLRVMHCSPSTTAKPKLSSLSLSTIETGQRALNLVLPYLVLVSTSTKLHDDALLDITTCLKEHRQLTAVLEANGKDRLV